jgi:predicted metal-binding membrane protein
MHPPADLDPRTVQWVQAPHFLRRSRSATGIVVATAAWVLLAALHVAGVHERASHHVIFGHHGVELADIAIFGTLWTLMVTGMMLPLALVSHPAGSPQYPRSAWLRSVIAADITIWGVFGVALLAADGIVHRLAPSAPALSDTVLPVAVLAAAGLYQLLPVKRRFVAEARRATSPWRHTLASLGSCWALMTMLFALGAASLLWMAALTVVMMLEQRHVAGQFVAGIVGVALLGAGVLVAA